MTWNRKIILDWAIASICAGLGAWVVLSATSVYGAGVSSDSMFYISSADNIVKGIGVFDFKGDPMTDFPPLYPLILAILSGASGITPFVWGRLLNAGITTVLILSTAFLMFRVFPGRRLWFHLGTFATLVFLPLYTLAANIGTDLLFILFSLWFCIIGGYYLEAKKTGWVIILTLLAAGTSLLRWVGLALVVAEFGLIWAANWSDKKKALAQSLIFPGLAFLPIALWAFIRNQIIYGQIGRVSGEVDIWRNIQLSYFRIIEWTSPNPALYCLPIFILLLIAVFFLNRKDDWQRWLRILFGPRMFPVLLTSGIYFIAVILTGYTLDHLRSFDNRYQAPLYYLFLLLIFSGLDELVLSHLAPRWKTLVSLLITFVIGFWVIYQAGQIGNFIQVSQEQGVVEYNDYNNQGLIRSGLVVYLIKNPPDPDITLYSNEPEAVYFFLRRPVKMSPMDPDHYTAANTDFLPRYRGWLAGDRGYLVWLKPNMKRQFYPPDIVEQVVEMEKIYKNWDGEYYLIRGKDN